jgi:hypothetical protein
MQAVGFLTVFPACIIPLTTVFKLRAAGAAAEILPVGRHPLAEVSFVGLSCDPFQGESEGAERYGNFYAASGRFDSACLGH